MRLRILNAFSLGYRECSAYVRTSMCSSTSFHCALEIDGRNGSRGRSQHVMHFFCSGRGLRKGLSGSGTNGARRSEFGGSTPSTRFRWSLRQSRCHRRNYRRFTLVTGLWVMVGRIIASDSSEQNAQSLSMPGAGARRFHVAPSAAWMAAVLSDDRGHSTAARRAVLAEFVRTTGVPAS